MAGGLRPRVSADTNAAAEVPAVRAGTAAAGRRPAGVSRWVNAAGTISLAGFTYTVGDTYAGEPVEVVVSGGLVPGKLPGPRRT